MRTATKQKTVTLKASKSIKPPIQKTASKKAVKLTPELTTASTTLILPALKAPNKQAQLIALLKDPKGADIKMLMQATDWQAHSIRGFISGTLRKKLKLNVIKSKVDGAQRYRIENLTVA